MLIELGRFKCHILELRDVRLKGTRLQLISAKFVVTCSYKGAVVLIEKLHS